MRHFGWTSLLAAALACGSISAGARPAGPAQPGSSPPAASLSKEDRALLAKAIAEHRTSVTMVFAARQGKASDVASRLTALGATVSYRDDDVDYLRADVPVNRAYSAAATPGVLGTELNRKVPHDDPNLDAPPNHLTSVEPPDSGTPPINPYLPVGDIGAPQFTVAHPTYDGRGITLGIIDDGVDLLTPELRTARLADGTLVDKVVDFTTASTPDTDHSWVDMSAQVTSNGGHLTFGGRTYTVGTNGKYRIGLLDERDPFFPFIDGDINRDGNPAGSDGRFAVLWDTTTNNVWVDTDQDLSFADQAAMTDYRVRHDVGVFGTDDPATAVRDTVPFVVQTDAPHKSVNINMESFDHGTAVASVAVGKGFLGGSASGAAPEARLAVVRTDFTLASLIEGAIYLVKRDHVDVVSVSLGSLPSLNDTVSPESVTYNRLIDLFGVQIFAAAGNDGPTVNTVSDPSTALHVVSVGGSYTKETAESVVGFEPGFAEGPASFSSRGPTEDGALKPDLLAPGASLVATPGWEEPFSYFTGYDLPPGYSNFTGTSFAAPMAAGGAALLLSAARQTGVQARADQLRQALFSSTRLLPGVGVEAQGRGVEAIGAAWDMLKAGVKPVTIDTAAPVRTVLSSRLAVPDTGPGLYEREGWTAGQSDSRSITLTRRTGSGGAINYNLSWVSNDGTYAAPASVSLARGTPTTVAISIHPLTGGLHAAILDVDDPATVGIDHQVAVTVIAADVFTDANEYTVSHSDSIGVEDVRHFFFRVPAEAFNLQIVLSSPGVVTFGTAGPNGAILDQGSISGSLVLNYSVGAVDTFEIAVIGWIFAGAATPFTLTFTAHGPATINPSPVVVDPATIGTHDVPLDFATGGVGFRGQATGSGIGPVVADRPTLFDAGAPAEYDFTVPPGAGELEAQIANSTDPDADMDMYLLDCTSGVFCDLAAQSTSPTAVEEVSVQDPAPGDWVVIVDPFFIPSGSADVDFSSVITDPSLGSVTVDDADAFHPANSEWTRTAHITVAGGAPGPLRGFIRLEAGGVVLGRANVDLLNVG